MLLNEWLTHRMDDYLAALFQRHAAPVSSCCLRCGTSSKIYTCDHCFGCEHICMRCLFLAHRQLPTHRVSCWNGTFWQPTSLYDLGLVIHLGHAGEPCELHTGVYHTLRVGDVSGFFNISVNYCAHDHSPPKSIQLLHLGLFPCSDIAPQSAFTLQLLKHYDISTTLGSMSGQKYYNVLAKMTDAGFPDQVPDRYRELLWTHRRFCHLKNAMRSGTTHQPHDLEKHRHDHAIKCVACPAPMFNYNPDDVSPPDL
jgi:hypothetical protein